MARPWVVLGIADASAIDSEHIKKLSEEYDIVIVQSHDIDRVSEIVGAQIPKPIKVETEPTIQQRRIYTVLNRIAKQCMNDPDDCDMYQEGLEFMLNDMLSNDAFGTEGQCDPRGDMRNGRFAMDNVEGVD